MRHHRRGRLRRSPGPALRAALAAVLAIALTALVPAPASAADGAGQVVDTDQLLAWDGRREVFAVRWHLSAPVTRVDWLVATPSEAVPARVAAQTLRAVAVEVQPRQRWFVTHPWLLFDRAGEQARDHLVAPSEPDGATPEVEAQSLGGLSDALAAVRSAGGTVDDATADWARAAVSRGWTVHHVTVRTGTPTTLVGPVALAFDTGRPVVLSSPLPQTGQVSLITVAPRVLAAEQPGLVPFDVGSDDEADGSEDGTAAAESLLTDLGADAERVTGPPFTVENARALQAPLADLAGLTPPSGRWVVTALAGSAGGAEPVLLTPQDGPTVDWRSQVGVWWPGWGPAALAVLVALLVAGAAAVASRRRAGGPGPVVAAERTRTVIDTREIEPVAGDGDGLVDTRPDIHPVP